jgi:hypothetical protein
LVLVSMSMREKPALEHIADHHTILVEGRARTVDRGRPLGSQPCPSQRMPWTRTGRPTAFDSKAASIPASPASLRP